MVGSATGADHDKKLKVLNSEIDALEAEIKKLTAVAEEKHDPKDGPLVDTGF
jgi:hypothetical protein